MDVERCNYALTDFLLQSIVSITSPHCTLVACFIFAILALAELFQHLYFAQLRVDTTVCFMDLVMPCSALRKNFKKWKMGKSVAECLLPSSYFSKMNLPANGRASHKCTL